LAILFRPHRLKRYWCYLAFPSFEFESTRRRLFQKHNQRVKLNKLLRSVNLVLIIMITFRQFVKTCLPLEIPQMFKRNSCNTSFSFRCMSCRSLFVLLYLFQKHNQRVKLNIFIYSYTNHRYLHRNYSHSITALLSSDSKAINLLTIRNPSNVQTK
jgi:hypothetical protein